MSKILAIFLWADALVCASWMRKTRRDEASWFSGEYELLTVSMSEDEIAAAIEAVAERHQAKVAKIDKRFNLKIFRDEKFEFST